MTQHLHAEFVDGCYRCDLSRDEVHEGVKILPETIARCAFEGNLIFLDGVVRLPAPSNG